MGNKNKQKGSYHERWFIKWLKDQGIEAKKVPLSGALGGEYSGDIHLPSLVGRNLVVEVKYRTTSSFPNAFKVLEGRDMALYKRKTGEQKVCVILSEDLFKEMIERMK